MEDLNEVPSTFNQENHTKAEIWKLGGVYIGPAPADFGSALALNPEYLHMITEARLLADMNTIPKDVARGIFDKLCFFWLDRIHPLLKKNRLSALAIAESVFGFEFDEDPQMLRLDAAYQFHCGAIGLVYEICERANIMCPDSAAAPRNNSGTQGHKTKRRRKRSRGEMDGDGDGDGDGNGDGDGDGDANVEAPLWKKRKMDVTLRLQKVIEVAYHLHELLHASFRSYLSSSPGEPAFRPVNSFDLMRFSHIRMERLKSDYQVLIIQLSRFFVHGHYRRSGDYVCQEKMFNYNGRIVHSHYWKQTKLIRDVISSFCNKNTNAVAWENATSSSVNFEQAVKYFTTDRDSDLPPISRNRRLFSFRNGILLLGNDLPGYIGPPIRPDGHGCFFSYDSTGAYSSDMVPLDVHSSRFFDVDFDPEAMEMLNSGDSMEPNILCWTPLGPRDANNQPTGPWAATAWPTPIFDSLFARQGYSFFSRPYNEVFHETPVLASLFQIYALFGRLLYKVNELDNFQLCVFILGVAGTGKSVICETIGKLYAKDSVGKMSSNCQQTFALSAFVDKLLLIFPEVKSNLGLAASDFQSMVTGESVTVNRKHHEVIMVRKWMSQLLMAGNDIPLWGDSHGALFRRLFIIRFTNSIPDDDVDTELSRRIYDELPFLLLKFHASYIYLMENYRNASFWSFADKKFIDARESVSLELSPVKKFLSKSDQLDRDPVADCSAGNYRVYLSYARLMELCTEWCKKQGIEASRVSSSNREEHNRKIILDSKYLFGPMMLPFTPGCPDRLADYVLGVTEHAAPMRLPPDWRTSAIVNN